MEESLPLRVCNLDQYPVGSFVHVDNQGSTVLVRTYTLTLSISIQILQPKIGKIICQQVSTAVSSGQY